jgi:hypothetical protein
MNIEELCLIERISDRVVVIINKTHHNPISYLPLIEKELGKLNFSGTIVFDLLVSNGYSSNRFVEGSVNAGKVKRRSMRVIDTSNVDKDVTVEADKFYRSHPLLVENNSILSEEEKYKMIGNRHVRQ